MSARQFSSATSQPVLPRAPWPTTGFVVLKQILGRYGGPIPLGPTRWWQGVKMGEFPKPLKLGGRTVWPVRDIDRLIATCADPQSRGADPSSRGDRQDPEGAPELPRSEILKGASRDPRAA
jgi:hypothetical protein